MVAGHAAGCLQTEHRRVEEERGANWMLTKEGHRTLDGARPEPGRVANPTVAAAAQPGSLHTRHAAAAVATGHTSLSMCTQRAAAGAGQQAARAGLAALRTVAAHRPATAAAAGPNAARRPDCKPLTRI